MRDLDADTIARALEGFEAIGLGEVAQLLREAPALAAPPRLQPTGSVGPASDLPDTSVALDARYDSLVPDDSHLGDLIDRFLDRRGG